LDKAIDLLVKAWEKAGNPLWDSLTFWRFAALILLTGVIALLVFRKRILERLSRSELRAHDRAKFRTADEILPEQFAIDVLTWIGDNADVARDDLDRLRNFCEFFKLEQNQFLITSLRKSVLGAAQALSVLCGFMAQHFFGEYANGMWRYRLYPELKNSSNAEKRAIYERRFYELGEHLDRATLAYRSYRRDVKRTLRE
jgi:hypothetical protein